MSKDLCYWMETTECRCLNQQSWRESLPVALSIFCDRRRSNAYCKRLEPLSTFYLLTTFQALSDDTYTADQFAVDIGTEGTQGQTRIRGIPLEIVTLYWQWEAFRGNKQAFLLVTGFATESLERRFDAAFGVSRTEPEYNDRLTQRQRQLEQDLTRLGEAYALDDDLRQRVEYLAAILIMKILIIQMPYSAKGDSLKS